MPIIEFQQNPSKESACWRMYGTWSSEPSCEKLKFVTHCRNCDVFKNAARQSIEKQGSSEGKGLALFSIEELIEKEKSAGDCSALPFRIGQACFAVASASVETITDTVAVHTIPYNRDPALKGLVAINNEIYSLVNLLRLLGVDENNEKPNVPIQKGLYKRVLVLNLGERSIAFYVDEVYPIYRYFGKDLQPLQESESYNQAAQGILPDNGQWGSQCVLLRPSTLQTFLQRRSQ